MIRVVRGDARRSLRRFHSGALVTAVIALLALVLGSPRQAVAHEIAVALAVPATSQNSGTDAAAVVDRLRLAIDQSPDVGHAPGPDAGDHLGGVDVRLIVLDGESAEGVGASVREGAAEGASVVVVVGNAAAAAAAAEELPRGSGFLVAVLRGTGDVDAALPVAVLRESGAADPEAADAFRDDFAAAYGRGASDSAGLGYDVGQLLDVLIEETGERVPDLESLDTVVAAARARLRVTSLDGAVRRPPPIAQRPIDSGEEGGGISIALVLVGVFVTLASLVALRTLRRRSTSRTG